MGSKKRIPLECWGKGGLFESYLKSTAYKSLIEDLRGGEKDPSKAAALILCLRDILRAPNTNGEYTIPKDLSAYFDEALTSILDGEEPSQALKLVKGRGASKVFNSKPKKAAFAHLTLLRKQGMKAELAYEYVHQCHGIGKKDLESFGDEVNYKSTTDLKAKLATLGGEIIEGLPKSGPIRQKHAVESTWEWQYAPAFMEWLQHFIEQCRLQGLNFSRETGLQDKDINAYLNHSN